MTLARSSCSFAVAATALFFIWYQQPDWATRWPIRTDTGSWPRASRRQRKFTRSQTRRSLFPEVFVRPCTRRSSPRSISVSATGQMPVALAQTALFAAICLLCMRRRAPRQPATRVVALVAALVVALFPPIPYFVRARHDRSLDHAALHRVDVDGAPSAGLDAAPAVCLARRPVGADDVEPSGVRAVSVRARWHRRSGVACGSRRGGPRPRPWAALLAAFAVSMLPWFTYNYVTLGRFTLSPAGGVGRGIWEGSWQATWSGRLQNELTHLADDIDDRASSIGAWPRSPLANTSKRVRCSSTSINGKTSAASGPQPVDPHERARGARAADRRIPARRLDNIRQDRVRIS